MVAKVDPARLEHAVQLYLAGKTAKQASAEDGVSATRLARELQARGIEPRTTRLPLPDAEIVQKYLDGTSVLALAKEYGVARIAIDRRLKEAGVELRGGSEANLLRFANSTREERQRLAEAAHQARRGAKDGPEVLAARALTRQSQPPTMSRHERVIAHALRQHGVQYVREKAVGPYNIDFAVAPVAVEVLGGEWHAAKRALHSKRTPHLFDAGWAVVFVWATTLCPLTPEGADKVVPVINELRRHPSPAGQYRVVRGDGELIAAGGREDYERTGIVPARKTLRPAS